MSEIAVTGVSHPCINLVEVDSQNISSFKVGIPVKVTAILQEGFEKKVFGEKFYQTVKDCADNVSKRLDCEIGCNINYEVLDPDFPGMEEAVSCATVQAVSALIAKRNGAINKLMIEKNIFRQFLVVKNKVVSLDLLRDIGCENLSYRGCSSFYGGYTVIKNGVILRQGEMEDNIHGVICKNPGIKVVKEKSGVCIDFLDESLSSNIYEAANNFSLSASNEFGRKIIEKFHTEKALFTTVDDKYISAWTRDDPTSLEKIAVENGEFQKVKTCNTPSFIDENSRKIWKVKKFIRMQGSEKFSSL